MIYTIEDHTIQFTQPGQSLSLDILPEDTVSAFLSAMEIFPLGARCTGPAGLVRIETNDGS